MMNIKSVDKTLKLNVKVKEVDLALFQRVLTNKSETIDLYREYKINKYNKNFIVKIENNKHTISQLEVTAYEVLNGEEVLLFKWLLDKKEDLYRVVGVCNEYIDIYFRFDVDVKQTLNELGVYLLNRYASINDDNCVLNVLAFNDFNNDFELIEFCATAIKNIVSFEDNTKEIIKHKLADYGYDMSYIKPDTLLLLDEFENTSLINWHSVTADEFKEKIIQLLLMELYFNDLSREFSSQSIQKSIFNIYGMYNYRLFLENKKVA